MQQYFFAGIYLAGTLMKPVNVTNVVMWECEENLIWINNPYMASEM